MSSSQPSDTIDVAVNLTVTVSRAAWEEMYGNFATQGHLRDDVKQYAMHQVQGSAAGDEGAVKSVRLRNR